MSDGPYTLKEWESGAAYSPVRVRATIKDRDAMRQLVDIQNETATSIVAELDEARAELRRARAAIRSLRGNIRKLEKQLKGDKP